MKINLEDFKVKYSIINWPSAILAILTVFVLFPSFLFVGVPPVNEDALPWESLDPSWIQGVLYAKVKHVVWGEDLVFTYGPLSFLATRFIVEDLKWILICFDLFLSINLLVFLYLNFSYSKQIWINVLKAVLLVVLIPVYLGSGVPVLLFLLLIFWNIESVKDPRHLYLLLESIILTLLFFIKFNTGLVSFAFVILTNLYRFYLNAKLKWWGLFYIALTFLLISIFSLYLNVSVANYISGGINIINGYNDVMYIFDRPNSASVFIAVISICSFFIFILFKLLKNKRNGHEVVFYLSIFSMASYILFKQGFTRGDAQHVEEFYIYFILLALIFTIKISALTKSFDKIQVVSGVFLCLIFCFKLTVFPIDFSQIIKRFDKSKYFHQFNQTTSDFKELFNNSKSFKIPNRIIDTIGEHAIDVIPWNMMLAFENHLNLKQRPIFQSYSAYNKFLGDLNASFYQSPSAPMFVLYEYQTIDNRYPLFDEPKTQAVLLRNYHCVDSFYLHNRLVLLLKKKMTANKIEFVKVKSYQLHMNDSIIPNEDRFYEIIIDQKIKGKIKSFIFHSPSIDLVISTLNGKKYQYRSSKNLLESGLHSTQLFLSTEDVYNYFMKSITDDSSDIRSFKIRLNDLNSFENTFTVNEFQIKQ